MSALEQLIEQDENTSFYYNGSNAFYFDQSRGILNFGYGYNLKAHGISALTFLPSQANSIYSQYQSGVIDGYTAPLRDRLRMVVAAWCGMIQARDVDPREPWPDGRHRPQDQAVSD